MRAYLVVCVALLLTWSSAAQTVTQMYQGQVAVVSQAEAERESAMSAALAQVLVRVSGHRQVLQHPEVQRLINNAGAVQALLEQFGYDSYQGDLAEFKFDFLPLFSQTRINDFLKAQCLPLWRANRPQVLVMASFDTVSQRQLLNQNLPGWQSLSIAAQRRGLPIAMPLFDLQDQAQISLAAVAGLFELELGETVSRYNPDALLLGRVEQSGTGELLAHWQLTSLGKNFSFSGEYLDQVQLYSEVIEWLSDLLSQQYAVACSDQKNTAEILLQVDNIETIASYAKLNRYLNKLDVLQNVRLFKLDQTTVYYAVQMTGEFRHLNQAIALDRRMSLAAPPAWLHHQEVNNRAADNAYHKPQLQLYYRWLR